MFRFSFCYDEDTRMLTGEAVVDGKKYEFGDLDELTDEELPFDIDEDYDDDDEFDDDDGYEECEDDDEDDYDDDEDEDEDEDDELIIEAYDMTEGCKKVYDSRKNNDLKDHKHLEEVIKFIEKHLGK